MPMKPHKGETQSDFMSRCMSETFTGDRSQEQAVAICMSYWREEHGGEKPKALAKQLPDPEDDELEEDYIDRCTDVLVDNEDMDEDSARDACELNWEQYRKANPPVRKQLDPVIRKTHSGVVQEMEFVLSDETIDRMGDIIAADGWDIQSFKKNPVALFNHSPSFMVGKWSNLRVEKGELRGYLKLAPEGTSARIDEIRKLVEYGILQAVSVGFRPLEYQPLDIKNPWGGNKFTKQELIETSLVAVPANANALAVAKSLNISPATIDVVFAEHGNRDSTRRRDFTAKHGDTSRRNGKGGAMTTLAQRIIDLQTQINNKQAELDAHLANQDDSNVKDADLEKTNTLSAQLGQLRKQHEALSAAEKVSARSVAAENDDTTERRSVPAVVDQRQQQQNQRDIAAPIILRNMKKDRQPIDYLLQAGVCMAFAKANGIMPEQALTRLYGDDDHIKVVLEWTQRAATAPAVTTVTGWAAELVQQIYADLLSLLMPKSVFPRFSAKGLTLSFGRAGKIVMPARSRTPTIAGSFVGEGMAIPVRQGAFVTQTFIPKKMAVITTFTREMSEHSIPAIEGVLRDAIQEDTSVAIDSVLLDANPATTIRPAGLLNGVAALPATALGGNALNAIVGDIKQLLGALTTVTYGNVRSPVWLANPVDMLSASLIMTSVGEMPFKAEIAAGTLANIPIIDSSTVPPKTLILSDAADFVTMGGESVQWMVSDQATLHMEDTSPTDLVSGSPGVVASPQRSLFQTDSLGLRMIMPLNWGFRRTGMVAWLQNLTW